MPGGDDLGEGGAGTPEPVPGREPARRGTGHGLRSGNRGTARDGSTADAGTGAREEGRDERGDGARPARTPERHEDEEENADAGAPPRSPLYRRRGVVLLAVVVLAVLVVVGVLYWLHARHYVSTDDAYIDGNVVHLSPQVAARILVLYVDDNQLVHPGDLLVDLDPTDFQVALDRARAEVAAATGRLAEAHAGVTAAHAAVDEAAAKIVSARAALEDASSDLERYRAVDRRARSRQELDHAIAAQKDAAAGLAQAEAQKASAEARVGTATAAVETAEGSLAQARAAVVRAQVDLGYASIRATSVGRVTQRQVSAGDYVQVGQTMFSLVSPDVWVTANFKETDLTDMRPGQPVEIAIDAYPGRTFHGRVDSIQAGSGARFSILPAENATGNFVKIVQRIPVKITIDPKEIAAANVLLAPGMSVVPSVEVR